MVTLIQEMLWGAKLQGVEKIIKIAQGNPKLIVAIMRYLVDKECLREQGNGKAWILPETTDTAAMIPTEIRGIYEARLEKIENSGEEGSWRRQIIDWAALIGERFSERLLEAALKAGGETALHAGLTPALKYLVNDARIFRRSREVGSSDLEFSEGLLMHGIVLENIEYDTPNRHGFIAKAMQELNRTSGINSVAPQLALHYLCAGEPENAVIYFKIAADVARNKYNFSDACTYLRKADELLKKPYLNEKESRSRLAILLALGDLAGINNVSFSDAQACYSEAQRIAREIGAEQEQVRALIGLGNVAQLRGSMLIAEEWYDKAKKLCIEKSLEDLRSRILKDIAQVYLRTAVDYQKAEIACNEWLADNSRKKETASDDMASEADVRRIRGTVYLYTGYLDNAKNDFTNALSLAEGIGDMRQTAYCNNCIGEVYRKQGQPEIAERYHQQAFEERKKLGDMVGIAMSNNNLGLIKKALHQNEAAKEYFNNAIRTDRDIGSKHREADSLNNLATLSRMMGDYDTAFPLYSKSLKLYSDCNLKNEEMIVKGNIALIQYERGDVQGATEIFENSAKVFEKNGNLACAALVYHNLIFLKRKQEAGESHEEDLKNKFIGARGKLQGYRWPAPVINGDFSTMVDMEDI
jgi:tetratricopeptide (TPR) repeat protein